MIVELLRHITHKSEFKQENRLQTYTILNINVEKRNSFYFIVKS